VQEYIQDIRAESKSPVASYLGTVDVDFLASDADSTEIKDKLDKLRERAIHSRELLMGIDKYLQGKTSSFFSNGTVT
jgi:hypothetical protein